MGIVIASPVFNGKYWCQLPVYMYWDSSVNTPAEETAVLYAAFSWSSVLGADLQIFVNSGGGPLASLDGESTIGFNVNATGALGEVRKFALPNDQLTECDVILNSAEQWNDQGEPPVSPVYDIESAVVHELGHCVGLADGSGVMTIPLVAGTIRRTLESCDQQGVQLLYGSPYSCGSSSGSGSGSGSGWDGGDEPPLDPPPPGGEICGVGVSFNQDCGGTSSGCVGPQVCNVMQCNTQAQRLQSSSSVSLLQFFRDSRMVLSARGLDYIAKYYQYNEEFSPMVQADPALAIQARNAISTHLPGLKSYLFNDVNGANYFITSDHLAEIQALIDGIKGAGASPQFAAELDSFKVKLDAQEGQKFNTAVTAILLKK